MNVLSCFDGISVGQIALNRANIKYDKYFASEIDKHAIKVTQYNFPNTIQLGDIKQISGNNLPKIDLLFGGNPCQSFSYSGNMLNFDDPRGKLFFEFVRILNETKPQYFILENVNMKQEWQDVISSHLKVKPIKINSSLVSAQNRERLYWTNISINSLPKDKNVKLKDILESNIYDFKHSKKAIEYMDRKVKGGRTHWDFKHHSDSKNDKSSCIVSNFYKGIPYNVLIDKDLIRKFSPIECERLQTIPDNYTICIPKTHRYKAIGNAWTADIITYILKGIND